MLVRQIHLGLLIGVLLLAGCAVRREPTEADYTQPPARAQTLAPASLDFDDQTLQQAATAALGDREGAVLVIDPQTGRLRAVVNPRIAFGQAFPPGSTIKPFTALAALRAQLLDRQTQRQCSGRYARGEYEILCSHPKSKTPFNLPQALAYSCNDYFGHVGERLGASAVNATLASFGFGKQTGVNAGGEHAGRLLHGEWRAQEALGDSENLLVTPLQLLLAYTALVNGGQLYRPQQGAEANFSAQLKAKIPLDARLRTVLLEGMRGAIRYGTADKAQLDQLPFYLFGKTGTSTASNGFQTQGWFVGFAAESDGASIPAPEAVKLGVLVFLKRAHGSQGAEVTRIFFERAGEREKGRGGELSANHNPQSAIRNPQSVKVRLVSENLTRELPFEAYIAGVVAAEDSVEEQLEALKALAVVSRTYALQNLGRHAREGFDFCSTTHCQRFWWSPGGKLREAVSRAVRQTAGEILQDAQGRTAESYFHAACGGQTANLESLWGVRAPAHLHGVRDEFCAQRPNRNWQCEIPAEQLAQALHREPRTDAGARLQQIEVLERDASGRAQTLALQGERRKVISGWDFKIIVGRALGWHLLKSSWFEVRRSGDRFLFTGRGFGHGLGLCQEGTHVMAARGHNYRRILAFYFPGVESRPRLRGRTDLSKSALEEKARAHSHRPGTSTTEPRSDQFAKAVYWPGSQSRAQRSTLASEHFRVSYPVSYPGSYPGNVATREVEQVLQLLEAARRDYQRRLEQASLPLAEKTPVELFVHASTAEFITATGHAGWTAAVTRGRRIETQPLALLHKRGILVTTLKHELAHVVIETLSQGRAPRWLAEGLAIHCAGEGRALARVRLNKRMSLAELERWLAQPAAAATTRELYARAYQAVRSLLRTEGEAKLWQRLAASGGRD